MLRNGKFYSMDEAVEMIGITRQALYNYEKAGKVKPPQRDLLSSRRLYTKKEIEDIIKLRQGIGTLQKRQKAG